jgi:hypothetical protein
MQREKISSRWIDKWMEDGLVGKCVDGWMDGCTDRQTGK